MKKNAISGLMAVFAVYFWSALALVGAEESAGGPGGQWAKLLAKRDALLAAVEKKPACEEMLLNLPGAADHDDLWLTLRRGDGAWRAAFGEVPGWHQATMKDWRNYYHANFTGGCWRPSLRFPADAAGLSLDGRKLSGRMGIVYGLDMANVDRLPPGEHAQWWDRFIPGGNMTPRRMTYSIDAEVQSDRAMLDLVLEGGVYWDPAFAPNAKAANTRPSVSRRPIFIRLQAPGNRFTPVWVRTHSWVAGFHEADTTGLKYADGRLTGTVVVFLHQDGWGPWGSGKHTQHEPIRVCFEVDARLDHNALSGRYKASFGGTTLKGKSYNPRGDDSADVTLPETRYEGAIGGRGGKLVAGRYSAKGDLEAQAGSLDGMLLDARPSARRQVTPAGGEATVDRIAAVLQEVRALHLVLQHAGLSYAEAFLQSSWPAPVGADAAEYLRLAVQQAEALPGPETKLPPGKPETIGDSPSFGTRPAGVENDLNVLPGDAGGWVFLPRWHVLGPFEQRFGLEHDTALAPDVVFMPQAEYRQPTDRFGLTDDRGSPQKWQPLTCEDSRLGAPWERSGMWSRYNGQIWYAAAALRCERAGTVWFSVEANDFAKLWVNDLLVWTDVERIYRYRALGRSFVPVALKAGENRLLVRVHNDRQLGWLRLALSPSEPATPAMPAARPAPNRDHVFGDARPPLAWDVAKGTNVAWRNAELGGPGRPVVVGDAAFVAVGRDTLTCVDLATGQPRWSKQVKGEAAAAAAKGQEPAAQGPVTDGTRIAILSGAGTLECYDAKGTSLWSAATGLGAAQMLVCGDRLVLDGQASREDKKRGAAAQVRVVAFDMAGGKEAWRRDVAGARSRAGVELRLGGVPFLLSGTGTVLESRTGGPLGTVDGEMEMTDKDGAAIRSVMGGPHKVFSSAGMLYLTSQTRHLAIRLWEKDGKIAHAQAWESNYGSSGFANVAAPGMATDQYLFTWHSSLAHTPHCPDPRAEVNVQDVRDGRWIARLKPVMKDLYAYGPLNLSTPVVAGKYLFLLGGRSGNKRNQIAVVTADDRIRLVARQDVEPGTTQPPVFAGERMLLRSPTSLLCVATITPQGKEYEKRELARTLLGVIGREPRQAAPRDIAPMERLSAAGEVPVGKLISDRPTDRWLGAGPFPPAAVSDEAALAGLRPEAGTSLAGKKFATLGWESAYNEPPAYLRTSELQGTGDLTPRFTARVDPACVSGVKESGLLYTVLENTHDCIVTPGVQRKGVTQWLSGQRIDSDEPLHLAPGLYPYLLRVGPEFHDTTVAEALTPVNVVIAMEKKALKDVGWPKKWLVLGPLSLKDPRPGAKELAKLAESMDLGGHACKLFPFPVEDHAVELAGLTQTELGVEPNRALEFVRPGVPMAAYAMAEIECPSDGYLYVTCSADAAIGWYVDGVSVYDRTKLGMGSKPAELEGHPFCVKVTRGRHVLAALIHPSSSGWSFRSLGGFSEKRGGEMAEFRTESKQPKEVVDLRLQPCFREVAHSPTMKRMWLARVRANAELLQAIVVGLPATPEAASASAMLAAAAAEKP